MRGVPQATISSPAYGDWFSSLLASTFSHRRSNFFQVRRTEVTGYEVHVITLKKFPRSEPWFNLSTKQRGARRVTREITKSLAGTGDCFDSSKAFFLSLSEWEGSRSLRGQIRRRRWEGSDNSRGVHHRAFFFCDSRRPQAVLRPRELPVRIPSRSFLFGRVQFPHQDRPLPWITCTSDGSIRTVSGTSWRGSRRPLGLRRLSYSQQDDGKWTLISYHHRIISMF